MTWEDIYKKMIQYDVFGDNIQCKASVLAILEGELHNKVIIEKGENRHPYADVLHEWLEGVEVEYQNMLGRVDGWHKAYFTSTKYRIKPSEPVVKYKYAYVDYDGNVTISDYVTEEYAQRCILNRTKATRLDWSIINE